MGNAGGSLRFGPDEDEEGEENVGEHFSQAVEMSGIPIYDEDRSPPVSIAGLTSRGGPPAEYVSVHTPAYGTVQQASITSRAHCRSKY